MGTMLLVAAFLVAVPAGLAVVYYWLLLLVALIPAPRRDSGTRRGPSRFCIVIPAHDEADGIAATVRSCQSLVYPRDRFRVVVIADNCQDGTAAVARSLGVEVLERFDKDLRGKGQALGWAFQKLMGGDDDAFVVLDADCAISPGALAAFDVELGRGHAVLQADNRAANLDDSFMSYALGVGNLIENRFFYQPKSRLGLAVLLRGTGMVLSRSSLLRRPWRAGSVTEDVEYAFHLFRDRERIRFVEAAQVHSPFPVDQGQLKVQRERWAGGAATLGKSVAVRALLEGVTRRNLLLADAAWTLLVLSRPLVILGSLLAVAVAWLASVASPGGAASSVVVISAVTLALLVLYFMVGVVAAGLSARRLAFLCMTPLTIARLAAIALRALFGGRERQWLRTPR